MQTMLEPNQQAAGTKKCPFCAEQIQAEAIKCRYCGEFLDRAAIPLPGARFPGRGQPGGVKWYYSSSTLLGAILFIGPLALPLVWLNPRYGKIKKILITVAVVVLTFALCQFAANTYRNLMDQIKALGM